MTCRHCLRIIPSSSGKDKNTWKGVKRHMKKSIIDDHVHVLRNEAGGDLEGLSTSELAATKTIDPRHLKPFSARTHYSTVITGFFASSNCIFSSRCV